MANIYALIDPRSNEVRYVGITVKTIEYRRRRHVDHAKEGGDTHRDKWIRQLLAEGLQPAVVLLEKTDDRTREAHWIAAYREQGARLTNLTAGGDGTPGYRFTEEQRARIAASVSEAQRGRQVSEETRQRIREALKGRPMSEERRAKISAAMQGKPKSKEHRRKTGETSRGRRDTPETKKKRAAVAVDRWKNPEYREKVLEGMRRHFASRVSSPTKDTGPAGGAELPAEPDQG